MLEKKSYEPGQAAFPRTAADGCGTVIDLDHVRGLEAGEEVLAGLDECLVRIPSKPITDSM